MAFVLLAKVHLIGYPVLFLSAKAIQKFFCRTAGGMHTVQGGLVKLIGPYIGLCVGRTSMEAPL